MKDEPEIEAGGEVAFLLLGLLVVAFSVALFCGAAISFYER